MSTASGIRNKAEELDYSTGRSAIKFPVELIPNLLSALDAFIIWFSCLTGGVIYQLLTAGHEFGMQSQFGVGLLAAFIYTLRMNGTGYYALQESAKPRVEAREILVCWFTTGLLLALIAFLLKISADYSRGEFVTFYVLAPIPLLGARKATKAFLVQAVGRGAIGRRDTVLIGDFKEMAALESGDLLALCGVSEVTRFPLSQEDKEFDRSSEDARVINNAASFVRLHNCRQILVAVPWSDAGRIEFIRDQIRTLPVTARLLPDSSVRALSDLTWSVRKHALAIELQGTPLSGAQRFVKRVMDIVIASLALVLFLPVMTFAAIAIKMDSPGPVIFRQIRRGFNGKHFVILKFRTMTVQEDGPDVVQAKQGDPRVTPIGWLLRSSSIDELPQLWNVLRGEMSLIGPRPHALAHDNYFESVLRDYALRHHVKPGITGWAQCNGARGATPSIEQIGKRVTLDLWYIKNWSLPLDVLILVKTVLEVLRRRNAY